MSIGPSYGEHAARLLAFIRARVPSTVAEDIHHDVWVAAIRHADALTGDDLRRWLFRVATNKVLDYRRRASTRYETGGDEHEATDATESTINAIVKSENLDKLRECVDKLADGYRLVVKARLEGLSPDETAGHLNIPRETVDTRFFRAKERLRDCVGEASE